MRVVLLDPEGRVLLFRTVDPTMPEVGEWWELPGGGMDPGENWSTTAARELFEETGLRVSPERFSAPSWRRTATYVRRHRRVLQHELIVCARLAAVKPQLASSGRTPEEQEQILDALWWPVSDIAASSERFYPGALAALLPRFLAGEELDEPFEYWN